MMFNVPVEQLIQGKQARSKNEYYYSVALEILELSYIYEYILYYSGGASGEIKVDFLVFTPLAYPVELVSDYWHKTQDERFRYSLVEQHFNRPITFVDEADSASVDICIATIRRDLL